MNVERYIFQSPYSSSVQIGRPDPSSKKEDLGIESSKIPNQTLQDAKTFAASQVNEVTPTVESSQLLDVYA